MKKTLFVILILFATTKAFCQKGSLYGPLPHRMPNEMIGEDYRITPLDLESDRRYSFLNQMIKGQEEDISKNMEGKILKLVEIKKTGNGEFDLIAILKDADGNLYSSTITQKTSINDVISVSDFEQTKKLLLNNPIWIKTPFTKWDKTRKVDIPIQRLDKLIVIGVEYGPMTNLPIQLTLKKSDGFIFNKFVTLSGTNVDYDPKNWFSTNYYITDPKLKYRFTPLVWKKVTDGDVTIGMPQDAVELVLGRPDKINTTTNATGTTYQYVYGDTNPSYYYFKGDKLTAIQR